MRVRKLPRTDGTMRQGDGHFLPLLQQPGGDSTGWLRQGELQATPRPHPAAAQFTPVTQKSPGSHGLYGAGTDPNPLLDPAFSDPHLLSIYCIGITAMNQTQLLPHQAHAPLSSPAQQSLTFQMSCPFAWGSSLHPPHQPQLLLIQKDPPQRSPCPLHPISAASSVKWGQ